MTPVLHGFNPTLLLVLNLAGTFVFGLSGGLKAVSARLDIVGVVVLAVVVGIAGGITRDVLIGIPPQTVRDWRYLAAGVAAGLMTFVAHAALTRLERPILVLDAAGLALFCVTGAATAVDHQVAAAEAIVLGAISGVGGVRCETYWSARSPWCSEPGSTPSLRWRARPWSSPRRSWTHTVSCGR
jgi:uncharacterized membrane protein YeiH